MTDADRLSAAALRRCFLDFFHAHGHTIVASSPLVPPNDPTLMFVNAGMVQFKDLFAGVERRDYKRATSSQKCMRVSGKHNDLEEVGRTARHHTFFEMLGNFSFGDYFKEEAITLAWDFSVKQMGLDPLRIWITIFGGGEGVPADDEADALWRKVTGLPAHRILRMGMKDNFWAMGDTGPCGPCTELHYNLAENASDPTPADFESGRVVEFWNNVFMQFDRQPGGALAPLPAPSVDTGMGLERLAALVQGQISNYHTDLFRPILAAICDAAGKQYRRSDSDDDMSMRVIADHARATAFLVADGIQPSNEGRGYVLRRIMRRAIRHGKRLGLDDLFFARICAVVVDGMAAAYPELHDARALIGKVADLEETGFRRTLDSGLTILEREIRQAHAHASPRLEGGVVFRLYDTYGFPKDLTEVIAAEAGLSVDESGFHSAMAAQKERSRGSEVGGHAVASIYKEVARQVGEVRFVGYVHEDEPIDTRAGRWRRRDAGGVQYVEVETRVAALIVDGEQTQAAKAGTVAQVVLSPTPFYGESGGQVGDSGVLTAAGQSKGKGGGAAAMRAEVTDSQRPVEGLTVSTARVVAGELRVGDVVWAGYGASRRKAIRAHHSATHLLHASLRKVLGDHVKQAGSLVDAEHLRFDYSHFEALTDAQRTAVEDDANARVANSTAVSTDVLAFDEAKHKGAIALFGEKYGEVVRVVTMGGCVEFCGGTHVRDTAELGMILVTHEEAVASGVRRIEAEVGAAAARTVRETAAAIATAADIIAGRARYEGDDPILLAVAKAARQDAGLRADLRALAAQTEQIDTQIHVAPLGEPVSLQQARAIRDCWQALIQLANARGAAAEQVLERCAGVDAFGVLRAYAGLCAANRTHERRLEDAKRARLASSADALLGIVEQLGGVRVLAARVDGVDSKQLRSMADDLRTKLGSGILCLGAPQAQGKVSLLVAVTEDLTGRFKAGALVGQLAPIIGGRGGGKAELAQAGGDQPEALDTAFAKLKQLVHAG